MKKNINLSNIKVEEIQGVQEEIKAKETSKDEIKNDLVRYLINTEKWDYQKSVNFSHYMDAMFSNSPVCPPIHEKVLTIFPGKDSEKYLTNYLSMAQEIIRVCMYTFTNRTLMEALIEAKKRGVIVQLITDKESLSTLYIHEMAACGIKCTHHNLTNTAKMHHKFAIVDQFLLINGSLNWTAKGVKQNHENVIVSGSKVFIKEFTEEFEDLWK